MDPLSKRVFALKVVSVVGVVFAVVGVFSIIIGAHDFVPAYEELTAMQAMTEAAMAAAAAAQAENPTTTQAPETNATEAPAPPVQLPPEVKMLIGKVGDGMFKMQVGAFFLFTGITMIVACVVVFFCCIKPYLEAAAGNGGRSMQYNVVTMSGHDDTKA